MRHVLTALALLLVASPAFAAETFSDPKALVERLYSSYSSGDFPNLEELQSKRLNDLYEADAKEANGEIGRIDFDPFINGQDYDIAKLEIGDAYLAGGKALVRVSFSNFDVANEVGILLVKETDGWKIDDVWNSSPDYSYDLLDILQAPMP